MMGLFSTTKSRALDAMRRDPDILKENATTTLKEELPGHPHDEDDATKEELPEHDKVEVPLNVVNFSHEATAATRALVASVGGLPKLEEFTAKFYERAFADPHIDTFIREHDDHHGKRFAAWIAEKMGAGRPWSTERATRESRPFPSHGYRFESPHDRSSAHFSAWHSPKRDPSKWGEHFKLDDCRRWLRLHFWAARETGVLDTPFGRYYLRFIAHFVSVYERTAPQFVRDAARWSADPENIRRYLESRAMPDVMGLSLRDALAQIPQTEHGYSGSKGNLWPYDL
mmetsp:Transcript_20139/g.62286  ORF Transcript_20139/g.62286 Transcript_20139/m.62286 type:complete len:285 (+) Transcript_20139:105-959(+)